ncbi:hypothetical protein NXH76_17715 [Blautia schinkii]|nr:hypothetical protein [Blautia schinkii]
MGITLGTVMFIVGIVGLVTCLVLLYFMPKIFSKQKKKLLEEIQA